MVGCPPPASIDRALRAAAVAAALAMVLGAWRRRRPRQRRPQRQRRRQRPEQQQQRMRAALAGVPSLACLLLQQWLLPAFEERGEAFEERGGGLVFEHSIVLVLDLVPDSAFMFIFSDISMIESGGKVRIDGCCCLCLTQRSPTAWPVESY